MQITSSVLLGASLSLLGVAVWLSPDSAEKAQAQSPGIWDNPQNLQVLPADISPADLRRTMIGAATGLGVRCWACHVGEEGQELETFDFISDEKEGKAAARVMFEMVQQINGTHMPKLAAAEGKEEAPQVRCVTCHRGEWEPRLGD